MTLDPFAEHIRLWSLAVDGPPLTTPSSHLLPVRYEGQLAMLKIARIAEERRGHETMMWWRGRGTADVHAHDGDALLLVRATGPLLLDDMARSGDDDGATRILCDIARRLHAVPDPAPPGLCPLRRTFAMLPPAARAHGGVLTRCSAVSCALLDAPRGRVVLHGDLHHANALDFGPAGWCAIDPKGLIGERGFEYATLFLNPDLADPSRPVAVAQFGHRLGIVAEMADLPVRRLLMWVAAFAGLSAAWALGDGQDPSVALEIAREAVFALDA